MQKKKVLITHVDCNDGMACAEIFKKVCKESGIEPVIYYEQYGNPLPEGLTLDKDTDLAIYDFSYSKEMLLDFESRVNSIVVLDHHDTKKKELEGLSFVTYDEDESGASLAWKHHYPDVDIPLSIKHVRARDLWQKEDGTDELFMALQKEDVDWDLLLKSDEATEVLIEKYRETIEYHRNLVDKIADRASLAYMTVDGQEYEIALLNNPTSPLTSDIGHVMCENNDVSFSVQYNTKDLKYYTISFRSTGFNVGKVAEALGGGGHRNSCGCRVGVTEFKDMICFI